MVSGLSTSPKLFSKMESGEASPIVILENVGLGRLSLLLKAMLYSLPPSPEGEFRNTPIEDEGFCF